MILIAVTVTVVLVVLVVVGVAATFLSEKGRLGLYLALLLIAGGIALYAWSVLNYRPVGLAAELEVSGLFQPTDATWPGQDPALYFVTERHGLVRVVQQGAVREAPLLDLTEQVTSSAAEQGLLSIAAHPDFGTNGLLFVWYTHREDGRTILARFQADPATLAPIDSATERVLLEVDQPGPHHNGGLLTFEGDDDLYLSLGEGGDDLERRGQDRTALWGAILRIRPSTTDELPLYTIPEDNPYAGHPTFRPEIVAYGLRNPWRYDFDEDGGLYIADVGEAWLEEINYWPADGQGVPNFGWSRYEGTADFDETAKIDEPDALVAPVHEYTHLGLGGCSIVGGFAYRGKAWPEGRGRFLFADFCTPHVSAVTRHSDGSFSSEPVLHIEQLRLTSFAEDPEGELRMLGIDGTIHRLVARPVE